MIDEELTVEECLEVLALFKDWNAGQKSTSYAFTRVRTQEDDVYNSRRRMLIAVQTRLEEMANVRQDSEQEGGAG